MNRYIPNQHGAWAMLILPFLLGLSISDSHWIHLPLFLCWLVMYLFSYPVLQWIKTGRKEKYLRPAALYGALLIPLVAVVIWHHPKMLMYGALLLIFFAVPVHYARNRNERALFNDIVAIVLFSSFIYPVVYIGGTPDLAAAGRLFLLSVLYFTGTALYVKTMIREKKNPRYYYASCLYHLLPIVLAGYWNLWLSIPFIVLFIRAGYLPRLQLRAKQVGIIEIGLAVMVYLSVIWITG
ncbi:YwiC-like family protein [Paenibacillus wulumuqiensis]|uniref:YwiC-like family protein n=1 Tax=Paenibacillus wulumuqiensis TaxID=1567107 RepID=UPI0009E55C57|nr:YwiC-like family protein [Paenibacillus wulumuqiensis]